MSDAFDETNGDEAAELYIYNLRLSSARTNLELLTLLHSSLRTRNSNLTALGQELSEDRSRIKSTVRALRNLIASLVTVREVLLEAGVEEGTPGMVDISSVTKNSLHYVDQISELLRKAGDTAREIQVKHFDPSETEASHKQLTATIREGWDRLQDLEHNKTTQHRWSELPKLERYWTEYLDFVAGLSLRHEGLDQGLSEIADAMTRELQGQSDSLGALAIPGREGSEGIVPKIVYLRFPEWSVWSLPLAAHELWLIAAESKAAIATTFYLKAARDLRNVQGAVDWADPEQRSLRPGSRIKPLLADAFATFTLGPAYAWSALLLALDPAKPENKFRSQVIFYVLDRLAGASNGTALAKSIMTDRKELARFWQSAVEQAGGTMEPLPNGVSAWLDSLLDHIQSLRKLAFSTEQWDAEQEDWQTSFTSYANNLDEIEAQKTAMQLLETLEPKSIRFALNAAWKARLAQPENADGIALLCREICKKLAANDSIKRPPQPSMSQQRWNSSAP